MDASNLKRCYRVQFYSRGAFYSQQEKESNEIPASSTYRSKPLQNPSWYTGETKKPAKSIRHLISMAWDEYKSTWEGFNDNLKAASKPDKGKQDETGHHDHTIEKYQIYSDQFVENQKKVKENFDRNIEVLKEEGSSLIKVLKDFSGIHDKRDLKIFIMGLLKLANECVAEFMKGYRLGRDDEFNKVMNDYFKDIDFNNEDEDSKMKKDHAMNLENSKIKLDDARDGNKENVPLQENKRRKRRKSKPLIRSRS